MTYWATYARERMTSITAFAYGIKAYWATFARECVTYWTTFARTC